MQSRAGRPPRAALLPASLCVACVDGVCVSPAWPRPSVCSAAWASQCYDKISVLGKQLLSSNTYKMEAFSRGNFRIRI